jgi:hypothetical protein
VSKVKKKQQRPKRQSEEPLVDPASTDNLVGFFALLLEIDRRKNPHLYAVPQIEQSNA